MPRPLLPLTLCALGACGGPPAAVPKAAAPAPASPPPPPPADVWESVLKGGGTWTLKSEGGQALSVSAADARRIGAHDAVRLAWRLGAEPFEAAPSQVAGDAVQVFLLDASMQDADIQDALEIPSPWPRRAVPVAPQSRMDGLYAQVWKAPDETVTCYGEGPPPDAPPCEDVCFAELCVSERAGIVELSGTWAPNAETFAAPGYEGFRERMQFLRAPLD